MFLSTSPHVSEHLILYNINNAADCQQKTLFLKYDGLFA
jgi:hypothetical protein